jgi:hypothetical protein
MGYEERRSEHGESCGCHGSGSSEGLPVNHRQVEKQSEKFTDSAGRFKRDGGQPSGAGYGERHGIAREEEKRLIRSTARTIVSVLRKERCQGWYLAAAKSMNKALLDRLDEEAKGKLEKNLQSDLTNIPKADILRHFDE